MFNIGGGEIIVIGLLALIVLGPSRLPGAARKAGEVLGDLRRISSGFQNEIRNALEDAERDAAAKDAETVAPAPVDLPPVSDLGDAIAAVSAQAEPPVKQRAPAKKAAPKRPAAPKKAAVKKTTAKKTTAKKATAKKATAKKAPAKKAPAKKRAS